MEQGLRSLWEGKGVKQYNIQRRGDQDEGGAIERKMGSMVVRD